MQTATLDTLRPGQKGVVCSIAAGRTATRRLCEMGFNRGSEVRIVKNDAGPIIVCLAGCKMALGCGLARKVLVEPKNA